jgi:hypothetical protein
MPRLIGDIYDSTKSWGTEGTLDPFSALYSVPLQRFKYFFSVTCFAHMCWFTDRVPAELPYAGRQRDR